ncbi:MAG: peptidoglycan editing factor PgeF [Chloroflexi bacterium]|nr:peptidoglycan editing factor PgeF [Chloroflexota bacterium]
MPFHQVDKIRYYTFGIFDDTAITHAVFTRHGGISSKPWDSLNMGGTVGDASAHVAANRISAFHSVGSAPDSLFDVWQVHSADVVVANEPRQLDQPYLRADAILTNRTDISLFMRFADCVPILLHDPVQKVIGLCHAGWQGTVKKVARAALVKMKLSYGCTPSDVLAAIGPSIGAHHYQVGSDVVTQVQTTFGTQAEDLLSNINGEYHFDLWAANRLILMQEGVKNIEIAGLCTACHKDDWFSHRAEHGLTGRFGVLIKLDED